MMEPQRAALARCHRANLSVSTKVLQDATGRQTLAARFLVARRAAQHSAGERSQAGGARRLAAGRRGLQGLKML